MAISLLCAVAGLAVPAAGGFGLGGPGFGTAQTDSLTLVSSTPEDGDEIPAGGSHEIVLSFSEPVSLSTNELRLASPSHGNIGVRASIGEDFDEVTITPLESLASGTYTLQWSVEAAEDQALEGELEFTAAADPNAGSTTSAPSKTQNSESDSSQPDATVLDGAAPDGDAPDGDASDDTASEVAGSIPAGTDPVESSSESSAVPKVGAPAGGGSGGDSETDSASSGDRDSQDDEEDSTRIDEVLAALVWLAGATGAGLLVYVSGVLRGTLTELRRFVIAIRWAAMSTVLLLVAEFIWRAFYADRGGLDYVLDHDRWPAIGIGVPAALALAIGTFEAAKPLDVAREPGFGDQRRRSDETEIPVDPTTAVRLHLSRVPIAIAGAFGLIASLIAARLQSSFETVGYAVAVSVHIASASCLLGYWFGVVLAAGHRLRNGDPLDRGRLIGSTWVASLAFVAFLVGSGLWLGQYGFAEAQAAFGVLKAGLAITAIVLISVPARVLRMLGMSAPSRAPDAVWRRFALGGVCVLLAVAIGVWN